MKASLSAGHLAVALLSLTPAVSALSWPRWLPEPDALVVRQDDSQNDSPSPTPTPTPSRSSSNTDDDKTDDGDSSTTSRNLNTGGISQTGSHTAKKTGSHTAKETGNSTRTSAPKKTQFDPLDPVGSVVMVTPAVTDGFQLYKIGDYVTWKWNYTDVQATPTGVDLYVKCSKVPQPWTLTQNMSYAEVGTYTWDTDSFQKSNVANPLLTEQYTLVIADADGGISATPEPGYLAPFSGFYFGLYEPKEYHDTNDGWQCASCSGATSGLDNRAVSVAVVMSAVTVLSFTWFVSGFGAFL
ncbi:hypothetical protein C7999DRAFT_38403 [Corynascus novoguineensis]|uniref:DUF7137 domain-containing protein n=1 Tax=Corynascus novoguineensis TaxID=1126955 RepID=A0AAN7HHV3_9PEZI|nr:hypothetical protein C7999DRAFT_38403 [Corynascus novoguineensis]